MAKAAVKTIKELDKKSMANLVAQEDLAGQSLWIATGTQYSTTVIANSSQAGNIYLTLKMDGRYIGLGRKFETVQSFEADEEYRVILNEVVPNPDVTSEALLRIETKYGKSSTENYKLALKGSNNDLRFAREEDED